MLSSRVRSAASAGGTAAALESDVSLCVCGALSSVNEGSWAGASCGSGAGSWSSVAPRIAASRAAASRSAASRSAVSCDAAAWAASSCAAASSATASCAAASCSAALAFCRFTCRRVIRTASALPLPERLPHALPLPAPPLVDAALPTAIMRCRLPRGHLMLSSFAFRCAFAAASARFSHRRHVVASSSSMRPLTRVDVLMRCYAISRQTGFGPTERSTRAATAASAGATRVFRRRSPNAASKATKAAPIAAAKPRFTGDKSKLPACRMRTRRTAIARHAGAGGRPCGRARLTAAVATAPACAGCAGLPPMPCFCNSINTRLFSASNCCKLETWVGACATGAAGLRTAMHPMHPPAGALAEGWMAPVQTCVPLACAGGAAAGIVDEAPADADAEAAAEAAPSAPVAGALPASGALAAAAVAELA